MTQLEARVADLERLVEQLGAELQGLVAIGASDRRIDLVERRLTLLEARAGPGDSRFEIVDAVIHER